jgi:predicted nuclease of predicted toxin-antitoxin system
VRFILDAQLPPQLAEWLSREFAISAVAARGLGLSTVADSVLFDYARAEGAVVLSKDSDFVELVHRLGSPPQIVWITCGNVSNQHLRELFSATFADILQLLSDGESLVEISDRQN